MMRQLADLAWFLAERQALADVVLARRAEQAVEMLSTRLHSMLAVVYDQDASLRGAL